MKGIKKFLSVILAAILVFALVACSNNGENQDQEDGGQSSSRLDKIQDSGVMIFATSADYPPFEFHIQEDGQDKVVGFEVEVAKLLAEELGVELDIQDVDFDSVLAGLKSGMYDVGLAGINPTPEREEAMDFSEIYYEVEYTVLTRADQVDDFKSSDDLNGINLGVQTGTVQADIAVENFDSNITQVGKVTDLVLQLQSGMIDAIILEDPVAQSYAVNNSDVAVAEDIDFSDIDFANGVAIAVPKGETELLNYINDFVSKYKEDGTFDKLYEEAVQLNEANISEQNAEESGDVDQEEAEEN